MFTIPPLLAAYFIGAIPFGLLISRLAGIKDIRKLGSGNIGATNVWRVAGWKVALWVYLADIGKGVYVIWLARWFIRQFDLSLIPPDTLLVLCAVIAILGNIFPVYIGFKGGKGVNTALGTVVALLTLEALLAFVVFVIVVAFSRFISLGSMSGALALLVITLLEKLLLNPDLAFVYLVFVFVLNAVIFYTHRANIVRLINGTENRFRFGSKTNEAGGHV